MTYQKQWYAGVDWASQSHHVFLTDGDGRKIGERVFRHGGEGLAEMAACDGDQRCARGGPDPGRDRGAAWPPWSKR